MIDDENIQPPNDELDRMIRAALAIETDRRGVERLERFWVAQSRKVRWQRRAYFAMSAAAAAVVLVGLLIIAKKSDEGVETAGGTPEQAPVGEQVAVVHSPTPPVKAGEVGRVPTEYERIMFIARTGRQTPTTTESKIDEAISRRNAKSEDVLAEVETTGGVQGILRAAARATDVQLRKAAMTRLLEIGSDESLLGYLSLVQDRSTRSAALSVADGHPQLPLDALLAFLDHDDKAVRVSAAMLLGHVNGPEVTRALIARVTEQPSGATEAWMALLACNGAMAEEFVTYAASRPKLLGHLNSARVQWEYMVP